MLQKLHLVKFWGQKYLLRTSVRLMVQLEGYWQDKYPSVIVWGNLQSEKWYRLTRRRQALRQRDGILQEKTNLEKFLWYICEKVEGVLEYHAASIGVCFFPFLFEKQHGNCRQYCNEIIVGKKLSSFVAEIIAHPSITTSKNIDKYVPYNFNTIYFLANSLLWSHIWKRSCLSIYVFVQK